MANVHHLAVGGQKVDGQGVLLHFADRFVVQDERNEHTALSLRVTLDRIRGIVLLPEYIRSGKPLMVLEKWASRVETQVLVEGQVCYPRISRGFNRVAVADDRYSPGGILGIPVHDHGNLEVEARLVSVQYADADGKLLDKPVETKL